MSSFDLDAMWERTICHDLFDTATKAESPVTVFLGGQPGAGKTRASIRVLSSLASSVVPIIGDDLRAYHPDYYHLMNTDPLVMPERTAAASGYWISRAVAHAHRHKYSCLIEGTWRRASTVLDTARDAKEHGRTTHAVIVAVPPALSLASIAERFYGDMARGKSARWTPLSAHDVAVENLHATFEAVCASPLIDTVSVASRENPLLATSDEMSMDDLREVFMHEFTRPLAAREAEHLADLVPFLRQARTTYTPESHESSVLLARLEASLTETLRHPIPTRGHRR